MTKYVYTERKPRIYHHSTGKTGCLFAAKVRVLINKSEINRILIRATNWVGDAVMTLPALEAVKDCFPDSFISVLAKPWVVPLFESHPMVNEVIPLKNCKGFVIGLKEIIKISRIIRRKKFDMAILFQNAFEAALIAYLGGIKKDGHIKFFASDDS